MLVETEVAVMGVYTLLTSDEKIAALEWPFFKERSKSVPDCEYELTDINEIRTIKKRGHFHFVEVFIRAAGKGWHIDNTCGLRGIGCCDVGRLGGCF